MASIYAGTIKYTPDREPKDSGYGPKYSAKVTPDDSTAPRTKNGIIWVNVNPNKEREVAYLLSLEAGDRVELLYNEKGDKSYYEFMVPTSFTPPVQGTSDKAAPTRPASESSTVNQPAPPKGKAVWQPMSQGELYALKSMVRQELALIAWAFDTSRALQPQASEETQRAIATTAYIQARRDHRAGTVAVPREFASRETWLAEQLAGVAVEAFMGKWASLVLSTTQAAFGGERKPLWDFLKSVGMGPADVQQDDPSTWIQWARPAWACEVLVGDGLSPDEAKAFVREVWE